MATSSALMLGDIALTWGNGEADLSLLDADLASDLGLRTAVLLSIMLDARCEDDDIPPSGDATDRRGWWADEFAAVEGDKIGSLLWLLERSKLTTETPLLAEQYVRKALAWMIEDGVVSEIGVTTDIEKRRDGMLIGIELQRPGRDALSIQFAHVWDEPVAPLVGAVTPPQLYIDALIGDSNTVGIGDTDKLWDPALLDEYLQVFYSARYALGLTDPPSWVTLPAGGVRPYAPGGGSGMGIELTFARTLFEAGAAPLIAKDAISGTTLADWIPTASTPAVNLFALWVARLIALQASSGRLVRSVTVQLGTNDSTNSGLASAYQGNVPLLTAGIRSYFPGAVIIFVKPNGNGSQTFLSTVRSGLDAAAAADPLLSVVNCDRQTVPDGFHLESDGYAVLGVQCALTLLDRLGFARRTVTTTPAVIGWGPAVRGAGVLAPIASPLTQTGDREILFIATGLNDVAITTPSGWTPITNTAQTSTFSGLKQRGAAYERTPAVGSDGLTAATSITDTNDFNVAQIVSVRGPNPNPTVDVASGAVNNNFLTGPDSVTGLTTAVDHELVLVFAAGFSSGGTNEQTITNAGLSGLTKLQDRAYNIVSDFVALSLHAGAKDTGGVLAASSATSTANRILVAATVAIKP